MHTIKITPNLLFEYQCTSGKFITLPNRIESKKSIRKRESNRIETFLPELECSIGVFSKCNKTWLFGVVTRVYSHTATGVQVLGWRRHRCLRLAELRSHFQHVRPRRLDADQQSELRSNAVQLRGAGFWTGSAARSNSMCQVNATHSYWLGLDDLHTRSARHSRDVKVKVKVNGV